MSVNRERRVVGRLVGAAAVLLTARFAAVLIGGQAFFYRDVLNFHYPLWQVTAEWVRAGHWPLWNPMVHFGVPIAGNGNYLLMYPPAWIRFVAPPDLAYHLFFVSHLLLGAVAFYGLCRRARVSPTGAAWAALWYTASGVVLSLHCVLNLVPYIFLAPWAMSRLEAVLRRGSRADTAWLAIAWALVATVAEPIMLAGLMGLTSVRLAVWVAARWRDRKSGRVLPRLALAGGLAVMIAGPALLEGGRLLAYSGRGGEEVADSRIYAQHPLLAMELWLPDALGFRFDGTGAYRGRELGAVGNPFLVSIFIGFGTLPLIGAAAGRGRRRSTIGMLAGAVAFLLTAAGGYLPVIAAINARLPLLAWGRYPQKLVFFAAGLLLIAAARGLDRIGLAREQDPGLRWTDRAWMLVPVAGLVAAGLAVSGISLRGLVPLSVLAALLPCLARFGYAGVRPNRRWAHAAGAAILLELGWAGLSVVPVAPARILTEPAAVFDRLAGRDGDWACGRVGVEPHPPNIQRPGQSAAWFMLFFKNGGYPYFGVTQGVHYAFDLMLDRTHPRRMAEFQQAFLSRPPADRVRLLQRAGVRHLLSLHEYRTLGLMGTDMIPLDDRHLLRVFRVADAAKRTGFFGRWQALPSPQMEPLLDALVALPHDTVFVDAGPPDARPAAAAVISWPSGAPLKSGGAAVAAPGRPDARLRARYDGPNCVVMEVSAPASGIVVFRDAFFPGWRVKVDNRDATVCRVDGLFLGVAVDGGRHQVEFRYLPPFWFAVLVAAGLGLVVAAGLMTAGRHR